MAKGRVLPPDHWSLHPPPEAINAGLFYRAYRDLVSERVPDGPIPWGKVMAYADRKRLPPDIADALWAVISRMDTVEREWRIEQIEREFGSGVGVSDRRQD